MSENSAASSLRLCELVEEFSRRRICVVGDAVADQFLYGEISRVSREAPVLILRHERTETLPGGAANCAMNARALGAEVKLIGVIGTDEPGGAMRGKLRAAGVDCHGLIEAKQFRTTTKMRILAGQAHSLRQQVIRVDFGDEETRDRNFAEQIGERLREALEAADAVIISDYNYGVINEDVVSMLREAATERKLPVLVDSRFRLPHFHNFLSATPNEDEVEHVCGKRLKDAHTLETSGEELRQRLNFNSLLVTRGRHGMLLLEENQAPQHIEAVGSQEAIDVTGAGDTVIATYTLALASGASFLEAAHLANHAGGIAVMKRGTATVSAEELIISVQNKG
ncbi:MAG: sugar kinase [Pyrinomonadaceae bacterium]|nr:sugar kinase [Pyrinomonadaceae bacterium]